MFLDKYENFSVIGEGIEIATKEGAEVAAKEGAEVAVKEVGKVASEEAGHAAVEAAAKEATENSVKNTIKNAAKDAGKYVVKNPLKSVVGGTIIAAGVESAFTGKFGDVLQKDVKGEMNIAAPAVSGAVDAGVKASKPIVGATTDTFLKVMKSLFGKFAFYIEIGLITMIVLGVIYFIYENFYKNRGVIIERVQSKFKMNSFADK